MFYITEEQSAAIVSHELAYNAVKTAFIAATVPSAIHFPAVLGHASDPQNRFAIKSATDGALAGLKVGSYFPTNDVADLPRHDSIILLFNQEKGKIGAIVEAGKLNAYRTAAADAVATDALARPDANVLAIFGTGHQAEYEAHAIARIRSLQRMIVVGRSSERAAAFATNLRNAGLPAEVCDAETACRHADIIITATTATAPLFHAHWVQPGCHISSMGSDAGGKQELPPELFPRASLFCDLPGQSLRIGEFQHIAPDIIPIAIGLVLTGERCGRKSKKDITIFDSSGIALQDLHMAETVIAAYLSKHK